MNTIDYVHLDKCLAHFVNGSNDNEMALGEKRARRECEENGADFEEELALFKKEGTTHRGHLNLKRMFDGLANDTWTFDNEAEQAQTVNYRIECMKKDKEIARLKARIAKLEGKAPEIKEVLEKEPVQIFINDNGVEVKKRTCPHCNELVDVKSMSGHKKRCVEGRTRGNKSGKKR